METTLSSTTRKTLDYLSEQIRDLSIGAPLPSVGEIRKALNVGQLPIQRACDLLEAQGKIVRKRRKGVFVSDHTQSGEIVIVVRPVLFGPFASPYYAFACDALVEMIHEQRPHVEVRIHPGRPTANEREYAQTLDLTKPEIAAKLRGVFSFHPLFEVSQKLRELDVPVILMENIQCCKDEYSVSFDERDTVRQYMVTLAQAGCKSVGVLGMALCDEGAPAHWLKPIVEAAQIEGLAIISEWTPMAKGKVTAQVGYEQFLHLWNLSEKPDGIIVTDDVACRGVLRGCLHLGVDLPNDIQLITHSNKGVEFPYHKSLTRIEFDAREQVRHGVDLALKLLRGKKPGERHIRVPGRLVLGDTTRNCVEPTKYGSR
jgi:DNA-binding LacI/PurR family transcriptional regulator